jgi:hypothetical protein
MDMDFNADGLHGNNFRNVGFVQIIQPDVDHIFLNRQFQVPQPKSDFFKQNPEAVRLWAKCFALGPGAPTIHIQQRWVDFFTMMLASPTAYKWASDFLGSTTLSHLDDQSTSTSATIPFYLPQSQPQTDLLLCSKNLPSSEKSLEHHTLIKTLSSSSSPEQLSPCSAVDMTSPTTPPKKLREKIAKTSGPWSKSLLTLVAKGKDPADITEPKARRRLRQKQIHKGYKASPYSNRNCLGCSMDPPTLSHSIIKNLGATVCKIDPTKLSLKELSMVKKPSSPGGKKQSGTSSKGANDNEVQKTAKNKAKK